MPDNDARKSHLISPATRDFYAEARQTPGFSFFDFLHGYVYARWPYLYIGIGKGDHWIAKVLKPVLALWNMTVANKKTNARPQHSTTTPSETLADSYHGKVTPIDTAKKLISVNQPIRIDDLEQVIPYIKARAIIQKNPDHIVVLECPCRSSKPEPCLPLDVCLIIGEPFASFVNQHHPRRSRRITREDALKILEEEDARGHVHHVFFKDAMLGRFYAICNCCSCCCGAMQAHSNNIPMLASSGYVVEIDKELCLDCGTCSEYCQFSALRYENGMTYVEVAECMGCGVCVSKCPEGALHLVRDENKGIPLEIENLMLAAAKNT